MFIKYHSGQLNLANSPSRRPDYEDKDIESNEQTWIKRTATSDVAILTFISMTSNHIWKEEEMRPWVFLFIGNKNYNRNIIAYTTLQEVVADELAYEETSLAIQIAIQALQEVDPLAIRWRSALNKVFRALSDITKAHLGAESLKKPKVVKDSDLPFTLLSSQNDMSVMS